MNFNKKIKSLIRFKIKNKMLKRNKNKVPNMIT